MCFQEPSRHDHLDTVYTLVKVFIPARWEHAQGFVDPEIAPSVKRIAILNVKKTWSWCLTWQFPISRQFTEAGISWLGHSNLGFLGHRWVVFYRTLHQGDQILVKLEMASARTQDRGTSTPSCPVVRAQGLQMRRLHNERAEAQGMEQQEAEGRLRVMPWFEASKPTPVTYFIKDMCPKPTQTLQPTGDQQSKHFYVWGMFLFKPWHLSTKRVPHQPGLSEIFSLKDR